MQNISFTPPIAGKSVVLTIDIDLQRAAEQALTDQIDRVNAEGCAKWRPKFAPNPVWSSP